MWFGQAVPIRSPNILRDTLGKALARKVEICGLWFRSYSRGKVDFYVFEYQTQDDRNLGIDYGFGNLATLEND